MTYEGRKKICKGKMNQKRKGGGEMTERKEKNGLIQLKRKIKIR